MDILQKTIAYSQLSISCGEVAAKTYVKTGRSIAPQTKDHVVSVAADQSSCVVLHSKNTYFVNYQARASQNTSTILLPKKIAFLIQ